MSTITEEEGSMSDRSTQLQTQERTGSQTQTSAPGERVTRQQDAGQKQVTTALPSMSVRFKIEFIGNRPQ